MDQPPPKRRRFRFGLRTLLLLVAFCGIALCVYQLIPKRLDLKFNRDVSVSDATPQEVERRFGKPDEILQYGDGYYRWNYVRGPEFLWVEFNEKDRSVFYKYGNESEKWSRGWSAVGMVEPHRPSFPPQKK